MNSVYWSKATSLYDHGMSLDHFKIKGTSVVIIYIMTCILTHARYNKFEYNIMLYTILQ